MVLGVPVTVALITAHGDLMDMGVDSTFPIIPQEARLLYFALILNIMGIVTDLERADHIIVRLLPSQYNFINSSHLKKLLY